jgi:hypothetical protein
MLFHCVTISVCHLHVSVSKQLGDHSNAGAKVCKADPFVFLYCVICGWLLLVLVLDLKGVLIIFKYLGYNFFFFVFIFFSELICICSVVQVANSCPLVFVWMTRPICNMRSVEIGFLYISKFSSFFYSWLLDPGSLSYFVFVVPYLRTKWCRIAPPN